MAQRTCSVPGLLAMTTALLLVGVGSSLYAESLNDYAPETPFRYVHDVPAVSISYPWNWVTNEPSPPVVHDVGGAEQLPSLRLMVLDEPWWLPLRLAGRAASTQLSRLGHGLEIVSAETLEVDGIWFNLTEMRWTIDVGPGVDLHTLLASTFVDDKWVIAMVSTGQQASHRGGLAENAKEPFPDELREVALSLRPLK